MFILFGETRGIMGTNNRWEKVSKKEKKKREKINGNEEYEIRKIKENVWKNEKLEKWK